MGNLVHDKSGNGLIQINLDDDNYKRVKIVHGLEGATKDISATDPLPVELVAQIAGERNVNSSTNSYLITKNECNKSDVATSQTDSAVSSGSPSYLLGVYALSASGTFTIKDGTTSEYTITIGAVGVIDLGNYAAGIRFDTDIRVTTDANANVKLYWRPI